MTPNETCYWCWWGEQKPGYCKVHQNYCMFVHCQYILHRLTNQRAGVLGSHLWLVGCLSLCIRPHSITHTSGRTLEGNGWMIQNLNVSLEATRNKPNNLNIGTIVVGIYLNAFLSSLIVWVRVFLLLVLFMEAVPVSSSSPLIFLRSWWRHLLMTSSSL